jgi:hypothetical protein
MLIAEALSFRIDGAAVYSTQQHPTLSARSAIRLLWAGSPHTRFWVISIRDLQCLPGVIPLPVATL